MSMNFSRKRVALACTFCRHRKRRCDAGRPSCRNCQEAGVMCQYDDLPSQRIDTTGGSREILSRLRNIESLLQTNTETVAALAQTGPPSSLASVLASPTSSTLEARPVSPILTDPSLRQPSHQQSYPQQQPHPPHPSQQQQPQAQSQTQAQSLEYPNSYPPSHSLPFPLYGQSQGPWLPPPFSVGTPAYPPPPPSQSIGSLGESLPPLDIPIKHKTSSSYLLGLPAMKALVGEYPPDLFFLLESQNPLPSYLQFDGARPPAPLPLSFDRSVCDYLVSVFFATVHRNHPIIDPSTFEGIYQRFLDRGMDGSLESVLCLVVLALGSVGRGTAHELRLKEGEPPGVAYIQHAMPTLLAMASWSFSHNSLLPQALVLASLYFAYIVRPLQSWRLIYAASTILQFKMSRFDARRTSAASPASTASPASEDATNEAQENESLLRLVWSSFLVECDRLAELELPRSGLQQLVDETPLPNLDNMNELHSTCFLAETSIRRLLNRIHNSLYPRRQHVLSLSSTTLMLPEDFSLEEVHSALAVCEELHHQLDQWYTSIPEASRPSLHMPPGPLPPPSSSSSPCSSPSRSSAAVPRSVHAGAAASAASPVSMTSPASNHSHSMMDVQHDARPGTTLSSHSLSSSSSVPHLHPAGHREEDYRQAVLRVRYFAAKHIIYRPFVLYIIAHDETIFAGPGRKNNSQRDLQSEKKNSLPGGFNTPLSATTSASSTTGWKGSATGSGPAGVDPETVLAKAAICLDSCRQYVHNSTRMLHHASPYTWTFSLSTFGAVIVLTLAASSRPLRHLVPDIDALQTMAIKSIRAWSVSSLDMVVAIMEDMQRKVRILHRR